ncbi:MAG: hypothetical protein JF603_09425, partial [Acidobacteria bacterium]|nr:hypothetical protein [Acidobacteriota bacterium]
LSRITTIWLAFGGSAVSSFLQAALGTWAVSFFRRYHGMSAAGGGGVVALSAVFGIVGVLICNRLSDRMVSAGRPQARLQLLAATYLVSGLLFFLTFSSTATGPAILFWCLGALFVTMPTALLRGILADVVISHLRGRAYAVGSVLRLVAVSIGPLLFGIVSDGYGLRYALSLSTPFMLGAAVLSMMAVASYTRDAAHAQDESYRQNLLEDSTAAT